MANELIERDFQKVYQELMLFIQESESNASQLHKLQELWRKCRENENRLSVRCRDLQTQVAAMKARALATAAKSKEDKATIASLKKELDSAWKIVDEAQEKEQKSRDVIQGLQHQVDQLSRTVEHSISLSLTQERLAELQKAKDDLTEEKERFVADISELQEKLESCQTSIKSHSEDKALLHSKLSQALLDSQNKDVNLQREIRVREKIEIDLRQIQAKADAKESLVQTIRQQNEDMKIRLDILENHSKETEIALDGSKKDLDDIKIQCEKLEHENDVYHRQIMRQNEESHKAANDIKLKEDAHAKLYTEHLKLSKLKDTLHIKIQKLDEQNSKLLEQKSALNNTVVELQKESAATRKKIRQDEKVIDELLREKSSIRQNIVRITESNEKLSQSLESHDQLGKRLNHELSQCKIEVEKQQRLVNELSREREKLIADIGELQKKNQLLVTDIKSKEIQLLDWQRKSSAFEATVHRQKASMDILISKHRAGIRAIAEIKDELSDIHRKLKELDHEREGLKEEVQSKDQLLFQETQSRRNLEKDVDTLMSQLQHAKTIAAKWRSRFDTCEADAKTSSNVVTQMGRKSSKQQQEIEKVVRDSVKGDSLLTEKNNEVSQLRKNLTLVEQFNQRQESDHRRLLDDIRLLKLEIKRLKDENDYLRNSVTAFKDLQREVSRLEKELMNEKLKNKGLELELENPHNIHRWRKLQGDDPTVYQLIQRNRIIQKRLIFKTEQKSTKPTEKITEIDHQTKLHKEIRKQSESQSAVHLLDMKDKLRCRDNQIKSLTSEQDVHLARIQHFKHESDKLKSQLREAKMQLLVLRKSRSLQDITTCASSAPRSPQETKSAASVTMKMRSFGSGFRIITSSRA